MNQSIESQILLKSKNNPFANQKLKGETFSEPLLDLTHVENDHKSEANKQLSDSLTPFPSKRARICIVSHFP